MSAPQTNADRLRQRIAARGPVIGRTVVSCAGCRRMRWYGIGKCAWCGTAGPARDVPSYSCSAGWGNLDCKCCGTFCRTLGGDRA